MRLVILCQLLVCQCVTAQNTPPATVLATEGEVQLCDKGNPCPQGYICKFSHFVKAMKICYKADLVNRTTQGRCPIPGEATNNSSAGECTQGCNFDHDCADQAQKCCYSGSCGLRCTTPVAIDPSPTITILSKGKMEDRTGTKATVVLIQSNGGNVIWDTGLSVQKLEIVKALREKSGLDIADINVLLLSSPNVEHSSNAGMFPDTPLNLWTAHEVGSSFSITNSITESNQLYNADQAHLQLIPTPGQTQFDTTLLVYNVSNNGSGAATGTVALTGDLIMTADDWDFYQLNAMNVSQKTESRRLVFCLADTIIPGHGSMFPVTEEIRQRAGDCDNISRTSSMETRLSDMPLQGNETAVVSGTNETQTGDEVTTQPPTYTNMYPSTGLLYPIPEHENETSGANVSSQIQAANNMSLTSENMEEVMLQENSTIADFDMLTDNSTDNQTEPDYNEEISTTFPTDTNDTVSNSATIYATDTEPHKVLMRQNSGNFTSLNPVSNDTAVNMTLTHDSVGRLKRYNMENETKLLSSQAPASSKLFKTYGVIIYLKLIVVIIFATSFHIMYY